MKSWKKLLAVMMVIALAAGIMVTAALAAAANPVGNDDVLLTAQRDGNTITVTATAKRQTNIAGMEVTMSFNNTMAYASSTPTAYDNSSYNESLKFWSLARSSNNDLASGEEMFQYSVSIPGGFQEDTDYAITFEFDDAFDKDNNTLSWAKDSLTVVYREDSSGTDPEEPSSGSADLSAIQSINLDPDGKVPAGTTFTITVKNTDVDPDGYYDAKDIPGDWTLTVDEAATTLDLGDDVVFPGPGTYTYEVKETAASDDNVKPDTSTTYTLIFTVQEDADGNLTTKYNIKDSNGDKTEDMVFDNDYSDDDTPYTGVKSHRDTLLLALFAVLAVGGTFVVNRKLKLF